MSTAKADNSRVILLTTLLLLLSTLACAVQVPTTVPDNTPISTATLLSTPTTPVTTVKVTAAQSLHVRVRPGKQSAVAGYLYHGDRVTLTGRCQTGWAQIFWGEGVGWVNARFLSDNICQTK
jgi:uncharacterized protein YgiM (DUF1202 family)